VPPEALAHWGSKPTPSTLTLIQSTTDTRPMRYNPATDRAISIDEIAAQCKAAILKQTRTARTWRQSLTCCSLIGSAGRMTC